MSTKEMIISHSPLETRLAIVEDGVISEVAFERERNRGVVGNLYKGRVNRVLPGMQSAFVDIGLERDAFLYVSDVIDDEDYLTEEEEKIVETEREIRAAKRNNNQSIDELLKEGQEVLVQVAKEPLGTKGARITSYVSLPGRLLVYMPTVEHIGVSRKIDSAEERAQLRRLIQESKQRGGGYIVRTAAQGKDEETIVADLKYLENKWGDVLEKAEHTKAPALIHKDLGLVFKYIRDVLSPEFSAIRINAEDLFDQVLNYVRQIQPQMLHRVKFYSKTYPIFEEYGRTVGNRQGAPQQSLVEVGRLHRDQPDRGARRHRREHRALHRRPQARGDDYPYQSRGARGDRPPGALEGPRRDHRDRLHRYGGAPESEQGLRRAGTRSEERSFPDEEHSSQRVWAHRPDAEAGQTLARARAVPSVPVVSRKLLDQVADDGRLRNRRPSTKEGR